MKRILFVFLFLSSFVWAQDPDVKNLVWNRYTTPNFTILSIDDNQGQWLALNLEEVKIWCMTRWGFPDVKFSKECRIFCVPNKELMVKLFGVDSSRAEVRQKDGVIEITAMWLILDDKPIKTLPIYVTQICFAQFEANYHTTLPFWAKRGISCLNSTPNQIKKEIFALRNLDSISSSDIMNMKEEEYWKLTSDKRVLFDRSTEALCLLFRKEFGEAKFQSLLRLSNNDMKSVIRVVYGYRSYDDLDKAYLRYIKDLTKDIKAQKTPDTYLQVNSNG
jgi:hypothetical protein